MKMIITLAAVISLFIFLSAGLTTCSQNFNLEETLDGPEGKALTLSPNSAQVGINETLDFDAEGGVPEYKYSMLQGLGTIDPGSGLYTAPGIEGTEIISVKDSYGSIKTASIEVVAGAGTPVLIISPSSLTVFKGTDAVFAATGGVPPYTFSLTAGIGNITAGGLYTAPASTGTATVRVTDSDAPVPSTDNATVTVTDIVTNVDYEVTSVTHTAGTVGGESFTADFLVTNTGSANGSENISWTAYISSDDTAGAGDFIASTGTITDPIASMADSGNITAAGTWPETGGNYNIVIVISASEDLNQLNNSLSTAAPVAVSDPPVEDIDYHIVSVSSANTPATAGSAINESFSYRNSGDDAGSSTVYWTEYRSVNQTIDGDDTVILSGQAAPLNGNTSSGSIAVTGTWPASAGSYYILVKVNASDDVNPQNNSGYSSQFVINAAAGGIDYVVSEITENFPSVLTDQSVSEYFTVANIGGSPGADDVTWTAYASLDTAIGGDIEIGTGTAVTGGLTAGGDQSNILVNGFWPGTAGSYYLIVQIAAGDDTVPGNNITYAGPFTVNTPPDYSVSSAVIQNTGIPGAQLSADPEDFRFVINNSPAAGNGTQSITWKVYRSFDNIHDTGDTLIKTGSCGALPANSNSSPQIFGDVSWPLYGSNYYIIITLTALDEINNTNNTYISASYVETPETYTNLLQDDTNDSPGPSGAKIDFYAEWSSGGNLVDVFLWDSSSLVAGSVSTDTATEPASPPSKNVGLAPGVFQIGVQSKIGAGTSYTLYISTRP